MDYKCQITENEKSTTTHYRSWKRGKSWCYGFSVLAAIAGCTVMFQETASADEVAPNVMTNAAEKESAAQTELTAQTDEQLPLSTAGAETEEQAPAEHSETVSKVEGQTTPEQATPDKQDSLPQPTEPTPAQPIQDLPDAAAPAAQTKETIDEDKVQANTENLKPENTAQDAQPQVPKQQNLPQVPELHREQVSPDATGVWGDISWVYDSATQTLRFTSSGTIPERSWESHEERSWVNATRQGADIRKIVFEKPVTAPMNANGLFAGNYDEKFMVEKVEGLEKVDVSATTNMSRMFDNCPRLTDVPGLSSWNVSNVTDMESMFSSTGLTDLIALSGWNVSNVTDMSYMFDDCGALTTLTALSNWNVSNVTNMRDMFCDCIAITDLTALSNWNVSIVTDMQYMFYDCIALTTLTALSNWNVSNVTNMRDMFVACWLLTDLSALSNWNVSKVENMCEMFSYCSGLENADALNNWQVQSGTAVKYMFENCSNLQSVGIAAWNLTENPLENTEGMFSGCTRLSSIKLGLNSYWLTDAASIELPEINTGSGEYTGEWIGLNTGRIYRSSEDFVRNYDGNVPDTYVWRKKLTATVHYDVNGGNSSSAPADETRPFLQGEAGGVTASAVVPVRDETERAGYEFAGWNTLPDGSGTSYQAGDTVKCPSGSTILYAQWREKLKSSTVTVHYVDENGNEIASPVEITGTIDDAYATQCLSDDQCRKSDVFYLLTKTPSNAVGVYTAGGTIVTYVYRAVKSPICLPPEEPPGPTPPAPPTDKEKPYTLKNMSLPVSATQTEASVTRPRVLPNTGSNSGTSALLAGAFSLLGAGVSLAVRLKRRRN